MSKFTELRINEVYETDSAIADFYNSVLERTVRYDRASAYFSSGFYKYISKGLSGLLKNGGKMRLILSDQIDKTTFDEILNGYKLRKDTNAFIEKCISSSNFDIKKIQDEISILSFLIAINRLDIKFVFREKGLYHDKFALLYDEYGNQLLLSGSNNETEASIAANHESFQTIINWDNPSKRELKTIKIRQESFEKLWNNAAPNCVVLPLTENIRWDFINKIDASQLKKVGIKAKLGRVFINSDGLLEIKTNFQINEIYSLLATDDVLRMLINNVNENSLIFRKIHTTKDLQQLTEVISLICTQNNITCVLSNDLQEYLESKALDLNTLSSLGKKIKNLQNLSNDKDFIKFSELLQNGRLKRPLKLPQLQSAYHICSLRRSMNFSVPGSGKTASVIGAFEYLNSQSKIDKIIVFGPLNCFKSWKDEFREVSTFYGDNPNLIIDINTLNPSLVDTYFRHQFDKAKLILINYEIIPKIYSVLRKYIDAHSLIVFDEIHRLKNFDSNKIPFVLQSIEKTAYRVALTGTPLPNGYRDLYVMFHILFGDYAKTFFGMDLLSLKKADELFKSKGIENKKINSLIFPFYVRTNKEELNIPPAEPDELIKIEASSEEKFIYYQITDLKINSLEKIVKLLQVGCLPDLATKKTHNENAFSESDQNCERITLNKISDITTSKIKRLCDEIKKIKGKCVVWCQFIETIERTFNILSKNGINTKKIYGSTPQEDRAKIIDNFINDDNIKVLVTNPHTLAESVSLHKTCHHAFYLELNYNLAHFLQSKDRIHRLGLLDGEKTYYHILLNYYDNLSIDYLIYKALLKKQKKMFDAIDSGSLLINEELFKLDSIDIKDFEHQIKK